MGLTVCQKEFMMAFYAVSLTKCHVHIIRRQHKCEPTWHLALRGFHLCSVEDVCLSKRKVQKQTDRKGDNNR